MLRTSLALLLGLGAGELLAAPQPPEGPTELPPVEVPGTPSPIDSQRPRYERMAPCLGCEDDAAQADDDLVSRVLHFLVLPSEPPDNRDLTAISEVNPPLARFDDKQRP